MFLKSFDVSLNCLMSNKQRLIIWQGLRIQTINKSKQSKERQTDNCSFLEIFFENRPISSSSIPFKAVWQWQWR